MGDDPTNEIFSWVNWDQNAHTKFCEETYGLTPKYDWALDYWGGRDIAKDFASSSNIIFSNGKLDPWSVGGLNKNQTENNVVLTIKDSPHHLDLRLPHQGDPPAVTTARATEKMYIKKWVEEYQGQVIPEPVVNATRPVPAGVLDEQIL